MIVDAAAGVVTRRPDDARARRRRAPHRRARALAPHAPISPGALADGTPIPLLANLGSADRLADGASTLGAEGVGLFRTEFLFLDCDDGADRRASSRSSTPRLLAAFPGKKVVVRALDAGADKPLSFLNDAHEENPALGLRGLRALRANEQILRDQLTALAERATPRPTPTSGSWRRWSSTVEETAYFVALAKELGLQDRRRDGRGAVARRCWPTASSPTPTSLASAPTTSPSTRSPPTGCSARSPSFQDPWHPGGAAPRRRGRRRRARRSASRSASAARPRPTRCWPSCSSASARPASRCRPRPSPTCAPSCCRFTLDEAKRLAEARPRANSAAEARAAVLAAADPSRQNPHHPQKGE